ncbi:MAG: WD40 repeat domain-containing protein, partial [Campylobacterales bacterium]|nr:WD40 repeat domain-containing protein [Campylobacterales bacterium]
MKQFSTKRYFKLKNPILKASFHDGYYYVIDNKSILYILDLNFKIKIKQKVSDLNDLHSYTHLYSLSSGIVSIPRGDSLMCVKYKDGKIVLTCKTKSKSDKIVFTTFNKNGNLLISCTLDGKVTIFSRDSKTYSYVFEYQPDYLSTAFFSSKDIFVYLGYFNLENRILNLQNNKVIKFRYDNPIENGAFFDNDKKLFLVDRAGNSIIYDCITYKIIDKKALFNEWVSSVTLYKDEKYILVGTRTNKLYLLEALKNELVASVELDAYGITSITVVLDQLILSYGDSSFQVIDLNYKRELFISHIELQEYHDVKKILGENIFLYADEYMQKFEAGYEKVLVQAKELIAKSKIDEAISLVEPFMYNKKFKDELDSLFMQQDHIAKFIEFVEKNNILSAYGLANKYRVIPSLSAYQSLEKNWEVAFTKAKKILEDESVDGKNKAQDILKDYIRVEQKQEIVKKLLSNADKFSLAEKI